MSAAAINFADNGPPAGEGKGLSSDGFSGTLALDDRYQDRHDIVRRVWDFLETTAYWELTPRPDVVSHGWCLAEEGKRYLVYLTESRPVDVLVQTSGGAEYSGTWTDAVDTSKTTDGGTTPAGSERADTAECRVVEEAARRKLIGDKRTSSRVFPNFFVLIARPSSVRYIAECCSHRNRTRRA
ncbi:MAG: hypothetical protein EA426_20050 [Spirochaetaceae bacterium]|nr:MAG: hypothetical protein EA426_20050 [Spirochaetaceae bacterium]